jgi:hypothetical protein
MPGLFCTEGDREVSFLRSTLAENEGKIRIFLYQVKRTVATLHTAWTKEAIALCYRYKGLLLFGGSQLDAPVVRSRMFFVRNIDYNLLQATGTSLMPLACRILVLQPYTVLAHDGELAVWWGFIFDVAS